MAVNDELEGLVDNPNKVRNDLIMWWICDEYLMIMWWICTYFRGLPLSPSSLCSAHHPYLKWRWLYDHIITTLWPHYHIISDTSQACERCDGWAGGGVQTQDRVQVTSWCGWDVDVDGMWMRYGWDVDEMWMRCGWDVDEMWMRCVCLCVCSVESLFSKFPSSHHTFTSFLSSFFREEGSQHLKGFHTHDDYDVMRLWWYFVVDVLWIL